MQVDLAKAGAVGYHPINELAFSPARLKFGFAYPTVRNIGGLLLMGLIKEALHPCAGVMHGDNRPFGKRAFQLLEGDLIEFEDMRRVEKAQIDFLIPDIVGAKIGLGFPYEMEIVKALKVLMRNSLCSIVDVITEKCASGWHGL